MYVHVSAALLPARQFPGSHWILNLFSSRASLDALWLALPGNVTPILLSSLYDLQKKKIYRVVTKFYETRAKQNTNHILHSRQTARSSVTLQLIYLAKGKYRPMRYIMPDELIFWGRRLSPRTCNVHIYNTACSYRKSSGHDSQEI